MTLVLRLTWDTLSRVSGRINPSVAFVFGVFPIKQHGVLRVNYIILCTLKFDISAICIHMQSPPPPTTMSGHNSAPHFQFVHFLFHFIPHLFSCLWMATPQSVFIYYFFLSCYCFLFHPPPTTWNRVQGTNWMFLPRFHLTYCLVHRAKEKSSGRAIFVQC